jgi:hypothetical protein
VSFKYNHGRQLFLTAGVNWVTANIKMLLVSASYNASENDDFVSDIPSAAIIRRSENLTNKSATDGYARASAATFLSLIGTAEITGVVLYVDTGDDATSVLLAYVDDAIAFPLTPVGFDYSFAYDAIEGGFFRT